MYVTASLERLILYLNPTLVLLISVVVMGQRVSARQIASMALSYAGVVIVFGHEHFRAWTGFPILGALSCAALIVQELVEDAIVFAYAGGLLAVGLVLWLISSRASRRP